MHGFGNGSFDPQTLVIVETAFDEAWITLRTNGHDNIRPDELARRILHLAMEGERDPVQLHDGALLALIPATTWRDTISSEQREGPRRGGRNAMAGTLTYGHHDDRTPTHS